MKQSFLLYVLQGKKKGAVDSERRANVLIMNALKRVCIKGLAS